MEHKAKGGATIFEKQIEVFAPAPYPNISRSLPGFACWRTALAGDTEGANSALAGLKP